MAQRAQESQQLRGQIPLLLEHPVWKVPEYLPTHFLSRDTNYPLLSEQQGCAGGLYQTGLVIKNWPWYIQNTDNPITGNWESNYCLYFDKMHRKKRVWPFPCHHQQRLASVPGAPCFPEGPFIICLSWGEGVQSISVSYCPFLFRQMLALLQFTRIGTGLRKSY